jgi:hypothetical protein
VALYFYIYTTVAVFRACLLYLIEAVLMHGLPKNGNFNVIAKSNSNIAYFAKLKYYLCYIQ